MKMTLARDILSEMVAVVKLLLYRRVLVAGQCTIVATSERSICMGLVEMAMVDVS